jgi:hypothetical protein
MAMFEFILFVIDPFWTGREQRKTLDRTKQALRDHARKVLKLDDTRQQSLWAKSHRREITFEQRPPIKPTLRQRICNIPHAIRFPIQLARINRKRRLLPRPKRLASLTATTQPLKNPRYPKFVHD